MKNHPAESLKSTSKTAKAGHSTVRLAQRPSGATSWGLPVLRTLKPAFLKGLPPHELKSVLAAATFLRVPANSVLANQDDPAKRLFLILTGRARYFVLTEKGQKAILLWIPPGEIFGMASLLEPPCGYLVSTETVRESSMLVWDGAVIRSLAERCPKLYANALSLTLQYLVAYQAAHTALICRTARERLAHVLASLAQGIGHEVARGVELNVRNEELANEANVTLFTASRLLNEWQREGILVKSRCKILLHSPDRLLRKAT